MRRLNLRERGIVAPNSDSRDGQVPWAPVGDLLQFYVQATHWEILCNSRFYFMGLE